MAQCISTFTIRDKYGKSTAVPCGKCYECVMRKASNWGVRLIKEAEVSTSAFFVTLTYNNDHVPITDKMRMTLVKSDLQNYMKRLRKLHEAIEDHPTIKYFAVGEYGSKTWRPHYHIILFNAFKEWIPEAWMLKGKSLGDVHIGNVENASVSYTLKYISKGKKVPQYNGDDRLREFSLMSKGLGKSYVNDQKVILWHKNDLLNRVYLPLHDGKKAPLPRYYKDKLYTEKERKKIASYGEKMALEKPTISGETEAARKKHSVNKLKNIQKDETEKF